MPPLGVAVALPVDAPQFDGVVVVLTANTAGSVITTLAVFVQPLLSVTVTL